MIKTDSKLGIEGNFLNLIKNTHKKLTANIILSGVKLRAFLPISETMQGCPLSPLLFNVVPEVPANAVRQKKRKKETKAIKTGKGEIKLSLFTDDKLVYVHMYIHSMKELTKNSWN